MSNATVENLKQYLEKMNQYEHVMTLLNWDYGNNDAKTWI